MSEAELIQACKNGDRAAQKFLFETYSSKMLGVCKRYMKNQEDAEDVLVEGLFKVLTKIEHFENKGSFEGWIRRIIVNEALMHLRKKHDFQVSLDESYLEPSVSESIEDDLAAQDILDMLATLPIGYRTVFNMYVVEGYKHREIAEHLGISINTSKSQLLLARKKLQSFLEKRKGQ